MVIGSHKEWREGIKYDEEAFKGDGEALKGNDEALQGDTEASNERRVWVIYRALERL